MQHFRRRLIAVIILLILLFGSGTLGYIWLEGWSWLDAFYMTTISLTTVGFSEVQPLSSSGRLFTIVLILLGVGVLTYSIGSLVEYILAARVGMRVRKRRMVKEIGINADSVLVGKTVGEASIRRRAGVTLVALIRRKEDKTLMPDADTMLKQGDELIVLGTREQLLSLKKLATIK